MMTPFPPPHSSPSPFILSLILLSFPTSLLSVFPHSILHSILLLSSRPSSLLSSLPLLLSSRPTTPLPGDRLTLQECLEPHCFRTAQFTKLRTITTKMNSIKQTKSAIFPVKVEEDGDVLWCTEMERLGYYVDIIEY